MDSVRVMIKSVNVQTEALHSMSASSEELSASIEDVSNMSQKVSENSNETKQVTELGVKNRFCLTDADMVDIYKTDHLLWRWRVYNMLLGNEKVDINVVGDYKQCRLGKWYYGIECDKFRNNNTFMKLEEPHIELHKVAKDAVLSYESNDIKSAERGYTPSFFYTLAVTVDKYCS